MFRVQKVGKLMIRMDALCRVVSCRVTTAAGSFQRDGLRRFCAPSIAERGEEEGEIKISCGGRKSNVIEIEFLTMSSGSRIRYPVPNLDGHRQCRHM